MLLIWYISAVDGLSSTFSFTTAALSEYFSAIASTVGASIRQGPHHAAQKSTSTGFSDSRTSCSKELSLTSFTLSFISRSSSLLDSHSCFSGRDPNCLLDSETPQV